jgi:hypothetical protein
MNPHAAFRDPDGGVKYRIIVGFPGLVEKNLKK